MKRLINLNNNIFEKIKTNKNTFGLMGSILMNNILYMFLNTFMIAYFIALSNYNYTLVSIYYIITFVFIALSFLILGKIIKNKNQMHIHRIGIILQSIYLLLIAFLKENILDYYIYLGIFPGIAQGFYWASSHVLTNEHIGKDSDKFISIKSVIDKCLKILFPIIFGVSIELTSFSYIAKVVLILSVLQLTFSLLISDKSAINKKEYNLKEFCSKFKNNKLLKKYYKLVCCDGVVSYLLDTLITIIIVMTFKTTISLGFLTTIFSICSIISIFIYQNKIKNKKRMLHISSIAMVLSVILLLITLNKITVVIYNLCAGLFLVLLRNTAQARRYTIISNIKEVEKDYLVEHQVLSEIYLNVARILGYGILFIVSLFNNVLVFKLFLILVTIIIVNHAKLLIELEKTK